MISVATKTTAGSRRSIKRIHANRSNSGREKREKRIKRENPLIITAFILGLGIFMVFLPTSFTTELNCKANTNVIALWYKERESCFWITRINAPISTTLKRRRGEKKSDL